MGVQEAHVVGTTNLESVPQAGACPACLVIPQDLTVRGTIDEGGMIWTHQQMTAGTTSMQEFCQKIQHSFELRRALGQCFCLASYNKSIGDAALAKCTARSPAGVLLGWQSSAACGVQLPLAKAPICGCYLISYPCAMPRRICQRRVIVLTGHWQSACNNAREHSQ